MKKLILMTTILTLAFALSACCMFHKRGPCGPGHGPCAVEKPCCQKMETPCQKPCAVEAGTQGATPSSQ